METVFGLIGDPVEHSLSPPMQNAAFEGMGLDARYHAFRVDEGEVGQVLGGASSMGFGGLNVTVPHKREALEACDSLAEDAEVMGAVNTVEFTGSGTVGHNTDAEGFLEAVEREAGDVSGFDALVLGAGGAARAMVYALAVAGCSVTVLNRTVEKAEALAELADSLGAEAGFGGLDRSGEAGEFDLVANATSVGMGEDVSLLSAEELRGARYVFDAVYSPVDTRLLREAEEAGATPIDGVGMLVLQGAASIRIWTGREPPVGAMEEAVRERLE